MTTGKFITFEGGEGSGKSTQARLLAERLRSRGLAMIETHEPGGSPFAEAMRKIILSAQTPPHTPLSEALLFNAARADHLEKTIRPALGLGSWVICDRFADSTRAYQGAAGGVSDAAITTLESLVVGSSRPDLTLLLDLDPKVGLARADARRKGSSAGATPGAFVAVDSYEGRRVEFHQRLRAGFRAIATAEPDRVTILDAMLNQASLADTIEAIVAKRFGLA